uniref:Uncharacterized protein n=1 Tax=Micrurus lemniscatus lemniscatus TaxID=129467 RepID=A0A2D4I5J0_MICLE
MFERVDTIETRITSLDLIVASLDTFKERLTNLEKKDTTQKPEHPIATNHIFTKQLQPNTQKNINPTNNDIPVLIRKAVERKRKHPNAILFGLEQWFSTFLTP